MSDELTTKLYGAGNAYMYIVWHSLVYRMQIISHTCRIVMPEPFQDVSPYTLQGLQELPSTNLAIMPSPVSNERRTESKSRQKLRSLK